MFPKINYHSQGHIISFRLSPKKSVDSDIKGNVVMDYDSDGNVVNIDVMKVNLENFVPAKNFSSFAIQAKA